MSRAPDIATIHNVMPGNWTFTYHAFAVIGGVEHDAALDRIGIQVLHGRDGRPVTGVIGEVQRKRDLDKFLAWPVYVAALRAQLDCPAVLLVVAPKPAVAAWARRPIELGHPGVPADPARDRLRRRPARPRPHRSIAAAAARSAVCMAHPDLEIAEIAIEAIAQLPEDRIRLYLDVILKALPAKLRRTLEARMQCYEYQSDFARKYYGQGLEEGLRAAVVALARTKIENLSDTDVAAIEAVSDQHILTELVTSLGQARSARKARAALVRALNR